MTKRQVIGLILTIPRCTKYLTTPKWLVEKHSIVVPLMVWVSSFIHVVKISVSQLASVFPVPAMTNFKVAFRTKCNAIIKVISSTPTFRFPMVWLPTPALAYSSASENKPFSASSTQPTLPFPSLFYSSSRKGHISTSNVINGWEYNDDDMWVLIRDGKSTNIAIMRMPPAYRIGTKSKRVEYQILHRAKYLGYSWSLPAAKRKAESYWNKKARIK